MHSVLDDLELAADIPDGVKPGTDVGSLATGIILGIDVPNALAQVSVNDSEGVWVPAQPAIYAQGGLVRLQRAPLDGGRIVQCLGPLSPGPAIAQGVVTAVNASDSTLTVAVLGGSYRLQYAAGTYAVTNRVNVLRRDAQFGEPIYVLGVTGSGNAPTPETPGGGSGNPGQTVARQVVIGPQWTGSYKTSSARWDSWNPSNSAYGGRAALYQGNGYGSGPMQGLAVYGDQIANLDAVEITSMAVTLVRAGSGSGGGSKTAQIQPSPYGTPAPGGGPAPSGASASVALVENQVAGLALPSGVYNAFRTGASKGLALVGSDYLNLLGTTRADGMALTIQYTVLA